MSDTGAAAEDALSVPSGGAGGASTSANGLSKSSSLNGKGKAAASSNTKSTGGTSTSRKDALALAAEEEKDIKRRSSKACDNCRKSKCKCARPIDPETGHPVGVCENCLQAGTECTYNGASRKRGPPKGYIEAIESRLHRMEALLGGLLQNDDPRAQTLLGELIGDEEARDVLTNDLKAASTAPPGAKPRKSWKRAEEAAPAASTSATAAPTPGLEFNNRPSWFNNDDLAFGTNMTDLVGGGVSTSLAFDPSGFGGPRVSSKAESEESGSIHGASPGPFGAGIDMGPRPVLSTSAGSLPIPMPHLAEGGSAGAAGAAGAASSPRQRRRLNHQSPLIGTSNLVGANVDELKSLAFGFGQQNQRHLNTRQVGHTGTASYSLSADAELSPLGGANPGESEAMSSMSELADIVGQLSLNENSEVRYHGRSSGLYLISKSARYKDFFWSFPSAGVWPPAEGRVRKTEREILGLDIAEDALPDKVTQQHLLDLYWTYVHPHFPIVYKVSFLRGYRHRMSHPETDTRPDNTGINKIPLVLLLSMFALAARYSDLDGDRTEGMYWTAGDVYLERAKKLLDYDYGSSRLVTVQSLLLLAYREIGTGAMSSSWLFTGMAIRMAQDLGLFRDVEKWFLPVQRFSHEEKQTRKRVWWGCIILDRYTASYIGRPGTIHERDYDTSFPSEDEPDEHEQFIPLRPDGTEWTSPPKSSASEAVPTKAYPQSKVHAMSCFSAAGALAVVINRIIANIYAIRIRVLGQSSETLLSLLDQSLASWYLALPPQLVYSPASKRVPPPHVLTLHLQFYSALILLHRPFIPGQNSEVSPGNFPSHSICSTSAIAIANIIQVFRKTFTLRQCPPFLTYPLFSAAIIFVYNASFDEALARPAKVYLAQCMDALKEMELIWGSAIRQWELLNGLVDTSEVDISAELSMMQDEAEAALRGTKRPAQPDSGTATPTRFTGRPMGRAPGVAAATVPKVGRKSSSASRGSRTTSSGAPLASPLIPEATPQAIAFDVSHPSATNASPSTTDAMMTQDMHSLFDDLHAGAASTQPSTTAQTSPPTLPVEVTTGQTPQQHATMHTGHQHRHTYDIMSPSGQMLDLSQFRSPEGSNSTANFQDLLNSFLSPTETPNELSHLPNSLQPLQGQSGSGATPRGMFEPTDPSYAGTFQGFPMGVHMSENWAAYLPNNFFSPLSEGAGADTTPGHQGTGAGPGGAAGQGPLTGSNMSPES
ncbi:BZ3500_MvSof-1268-A1-R1_Chr11-1g03181 [Microbotryum saponariae]|uniref:BZ3500_MvSof-1268-A1-R1_Chr11-1g03181 protein n=1 Tax=Microbotryum saponariae TaxID=289078 RepID=A0A2X0NCR3_9BASI|nr:BZ3501_MvSof-1269-A2-R1_Chr11g02756 [Microbotryum saponariae]SDA03741.1 BZ3500_MvSof-1268-A1-R1_Chr11-1g03181 [Microbotryum saponariae]